MIHLGTGTTTISAMVTGRNSIGYEIDESFGRTIAISAANITEYSNQQIRQRIRNHLNFIKLRKENGKDTLYQNIHYGFPVVTSQEKDLFFNELVSVQAVGLNEFDVVYADVPDRMCLSPEETRAVTLDHSLHKTPYQGIGHKRQKKELDDRQLGLFT